MKTQKHNIWTREYPYTPSTFIEAMLWVGIIGMVAAIIYTALA